MDVQIQVPTATDLSLIIFIVGAPIPHSFQKKEIVIFLYVFTVVGTMYMQ
jgi:hypothetical protein